MKRPDFYVGLHHPADAKHFKRSMISVNVLERRKADIQPNDWIMDSGAFTRISQGKDHMAVAEYALQIRRWAECGNLVAAVSQDYMCEPFILDIAGLTVRDHQEMTLRRYVQLKAIAPPVYIMPVLQGYMPREYVRHIDMYGNKLEAGAWVGVGSVCKRNSSVQALESVLGAIHIVRPDLKLHGFGIKRTALRSHLVNQLLHSSDSMAWSFAARYEGRNGNDWREAKAYASRIEKEPVQMNMLAMQI